MSDYLDLLARADFREAGDSRKLTYTASSVIVNDSHFAKFRLATNTTTVIGDIGKMGTISPSVDNVGKKVVYVECTNVKVLVKFNTTSDVGAYLVAAGGFILAVTTNLTGLRVKNPSTTFTSTIEVAVWDL